MQRVGVFSHADISFVHYLKQVLEAEGIDCVVHNDNVAVAGMMERTAQAVSPELWVMDDDQAEQARRLIADADQP